MPRVTSMGAMMAEPVIIAVVPEPCGKRMMVPMSRLANRPCAIAPSASMR